MDAVEFTDTLIVGAGMAGISCANALHEAGWQVRLFDKGRGPGGRMATRRVKQGGHTLHFDHGAQYFTARDARFGAAVEQWSAAGVAARWPAAGSEAWIGTPGMNGPIRFLAEKLSVSWGVRVEAVYRQAEQWRVVTGDHEQACRNLLIAIPPEQTADLLDQAMPDLTELARESHSLPCWAVLAHFDIRLGISEDTIRSDSGRIAWAARNGARPSRNGGESWVIHASPERSQELLERDKQDVAALLLADFFRQCDTAPQAPAYLTAHRWLSAMPVLKRVRDAVWDRTARIGLAGDWLHSPRVEGAWLSGRALADAVLAS